MVMIDWVQNHQHEHTVSAFFLFRLFNLEEDCQKNEKSQFSAAYLICKVFHNLRISPSYSTH